MIDDPKLRAIVESDSDDLTDAEFGYAYRQTMDAYLDDLRNPEIPLKVIDQRGDAIMRARTNITSRRHMIAAIRDFWNA